MQNIIDFTKFGKSYRQIQQEATEQYREDMLQRGMEEISKEDFLQKLAELGYKIDSSTFNYYNNLNEKHYKARSMNYTDIKTKQSFAHYEQRYTNSANLDKLQKIRGNYFVYDKGRIWDL